MTTWGDPNEAIDPDEQDNVWYCHRHPGSPISEDGDCDTCEDE